MRSITLAIMLAAIAAAPLPASAGRDQAQINMTERFLAKKAAMQQQRGESPTQERAAAGPAGEAAKEGTAADPQADARRQADRKLLKQVHPKHAYGY